MRPRARVGEHEADGERGERADEAEQPLQAPTCGDDTERPEQDAAGEGERAPEHIIEHGERCRDTGGGGESDGPAEHLRAGRLGRAEDRTATNGARRTAHAQVSSGKSLAWAPSTQPVSAST